MERKYLLFLLLVNGFIWARSSFAKFASGKFVEDLPNTLGKFSAKNPYPWYKDFLQNTVSQNSQIFGNLVFWGEALVAASIILGTLYLLLKHTGKGILATLLLLGLAGGAFLNLNFWLAAGWTSPSTDGLNLLMLVAQLAGAAYVKFSIYDHTH